MIVVESCCETELDQAARRLVRSRTARARACDPRGNKLSSLHNAAFPILAAATATL